jgi:hypothetical protein
MIVDRKQKKFVVAAAITTAFFCVPVHAKSWFAETCERLLSHTEDSTDRRLAEIQNLLNSQVIRNNRFTSYPIRTQLEELSFLDGDPKGIVLRPALGNDLHWLYEPKLFAFVSPQSMQIDWSDDQSTLGETQGFLLVLENVKVRTAPGVHISLLDLITAEADYIRERNEGLHFSLHAVPASCFKSLEFKSDAGDDLVIWVEGKLENFQAKRIVLNALEHAFETLTKIPPTSSQINIEP